MSKKKTILIICVALVAVAAIAAGVYFIGYSTGKKTAEAGLPEISEPKCKLNDFTLFDTVVDQYAKGDGFGAPYLMKCFNMSEEDANDLVEHPENWLGFQAFFSITNSDVSELSIFGAACAENGKDGVYVFTGTSEVYTIPGKGSYALCVPVLIHNNESSTDEAREMLSKLDVTIRYGAHYDPDNCVNYNASISFK